MRLLQIPGALLAFLLFSIPCHGQELDGQILVKPRLLADTSAIVPGQSFRVGLLLEMAPGWHTYWEFPGDAGAPTTIAWDLPSGFQAEPLEWPLPIKTVEPGDLEVYVYKDTVMLLTTITPPVDLKVSSDVSLTLRAAVKWLVCAEICVPGKADLQISLPVARTAEKVHSAIFSKYQALLPTTEVPSFSVRWAKIDGGWQLVVDPPKDVKSVDFFPLPSIGQKVGRVNVTHAANGQSTLAFSAEPSVVRGVLVVEGKDGQVRGWWEASPEGGLQGSGPAAGMGDRQSRIGRATFWTALGYGFLGGLILNLMPCVLPVISLKIFGFMRQAGQSRRRIVFHGAAFTGGIFAWFFGLATLVYFLKASGMTVTWAFQFQNTTFNLVLSAIVFLFALNLAGVFEIVLPGKASGALVASGAEEGYVGTFCQGVFATLLATPCTAPFLGTALGFAFSQSGSVIFAIFGAIAMGMSLPYWLLSMQPGWLAILPKPGSWMERLKEWMAFPLFATLLWLLSILGTQKGAAAIIWAGAFLLSLGMAAWFYGVLCGPYATRRQQGAGWILVLLFAVGGGLLFLPRFFSSHVAGGKSIATNASEEGIPWVPFSQRGLDRLLEAGQPVFVDFTAEWCLTCKFNEQTAIDTPTVRDLVKAKAIVAMRADWTNADPEITAALQKFGRVGVPFYVFYPRGRGKDPVILPELITEKMVLDVLRNGE